MKKRRECRELLRIFVKTLGTQEYVHEKYDFAEIEFKNL